MNLGKENHLWLHQLFLSLLEGFRSRSFFLSIEDASSSSSWKCKLCYAET